MPTSSPLHNVGWRMTVQSQLRIRFNQSLQRSVMPLIQSMINNELPWNPIVILSSIVIGSLFFRLIVILIMLGEPILLLQPLVIAPPTIMRRHSGPSQCAGEQCINGYSAGVFREQLSRTDGLAFADGAERYVRPAREGLAGAGAFAVP